jgi:hypothetical protein
MTIYLDGWMDEYLGTRIDTMFHGMDKYSIDSVQGMDVNGVCKTSTDMDEYIVNTWFQYLDSDGFNI